MIYDCVLFSHELDMLEIRLNCLKDVVDEFIIVESDVTHSGKRKPLILPEHWDRFKEFPITHRAITMSEGDPEYRSAVIRECLQRQACRGVLMDSADVKDNDTVLLGDLDEIPYAHMVTLYDKVGYLPPTRMRQIHTYWYINAIDRQPWDSGTIIMDGYHVKQSRFDGLRLRGSLPVILNAGWHFSSVGTEEEIKQKLEGFCHVEYGTERGQQLAANYRDNMLSIHDQPLEVIGIDHRYPQYIRDTWRDRYPHLVTGVADGRSSSLSG